MSDTTLTPEDQLKLARLTLAHRLRSLSGRAARTFDPTELVLMNDALDRFAAQARAARQAADDD